MNPWYTADRHAFSMLMWTESDWTRVFVLISRRCWRVTMITWSRVCSSAETWLSAALTTTRSKCGRRSRARWGSTSSRVSKLLTLVFRIVSFLNSRIESRRFFFVVFVWFFVSDCFFYFRIRPVVQNFPSSSTSFLSWLKHVKLICLLFFVSS